MIKLIVFVVLAYIVYRFALQFMKQPKPMPRAEAAKLLGLALDANSSAVAEAHRRLIARVHPDTGGSAELAAQINRARDVLLQR